MEVEEVGRATGGLHDNPLYLFEARQVLEDLYHLDEAPAVLAVELVEIRQGGFETCGTGLPDLGRGDVDPDATARAEALHAVVE